MFVVEQNCVFQDIDGADDQAMHVLGIQNNQLVAYARCFPAGVKFAEATIGRVVTRGRTWQWFGAFAGTTGGVIGLRVVGNHPAIRIGAQARLKAYYSGHGFVDVGVPYVEDGIDHLDGLEMET